MLGFEGQLLLRSTSTRSFQVVGECYLYGLGDAVNLLGPLLVEATVRVYRRLRRLEYRFFDSSTGLETINDPRLPPVSANWERFEKAWTADDPEICNWCKTTVTGEEMDSDLRMLPEALDPAWTKTNKSIFSIIRGPLDTSYCLQEQSLPRNGIPSLSPQTPVNLSYHNGCITA